MNQPVSKWANTEPDAGLPHALLERLSQRIPVGTIEELWVFPTRRIAVGESTIFVVAAFEPDPEKRRVITARYTVTRDRRGVASVREHIDEHGTAPATAVPRIVHGVLRRMDEEGEAPPRAERIERSAERWGQLIEELGGRRPEVLPDVPPEAAPAPVTAATEVRDATGGATGGTIDDGGEIDDTAAIHDGGATDDGPAVDDGGAVDDRGRD